LFEVKDTCILASDLQTDPDIYVTFTIHILTLKCSYGYAIESIQRKGWYASIFPCSCPNNRHDTDNFTQRLHSFIINIPFIL